MENQPNPVMKMAMTSGLFLGLALVLNTVIFYVLGKPFADASGYISYAIIIGGIAYVMYSFGNSAGEEGFPYGRAVGLGTLHVLFASIILAFFTFILYEFIDPSLLKKLMAFLEEKWLNGGMSEEEVEKMLNMMKKMMTPTVMSILQIITFTFMGLIFSLILALIFKKNPSNPFYEVENE